MPYRLRYIKHAHCIAMDSDDSDDSFGSSDTLQRNFATHLNGRGVGKLRADMAAAGYKIGSGAIQAAKTGSLGLRLETLQKFADYFGCSVIDLLSPAGTATAPWPFKRLTYTQFQAASLEIREEAEAMLERSAEKRSKGSDTGPGSKQVTPAPGS